jgi:ribulose-phosphate 3-epimerase
MKKRHELIPAILPKDFNEIQEKVALVQGSVKTVQIDACDGQFTQFPTWPYKKQDESFDRIVHEDMGLPGWEKLNFEIDLMVNKPEDRVEDWVQAGATRIIIHVEAKGDVAGAIDKLAGRVEVGLALNVETPIETLNDPKFGMAEGKIQSIQLMGIDNVGFQGQKFDERVVGKVKHARLLFPAMPISVDGGVSLETAPALIDAGADRLIVGSAIFESDNFIEAIQQLKAL